MAKLRNKTAGILNFSDYKKWYFKLFYVLLILILLFIVFISVVPPLWVLISGVKEPSELFSPKFSFFPEHFKFSKLLSAWNRLNVGQYYLNSVIVVAGSVASAVLFNGLMAYVISGLKPFGHKIIYVLLNDHDDSCNHQYENTSGQYCKTWFNAKLFAAMVIVWSKCLYVVLFRLILIQFPTFN